MPKSPFFTRQLKLNLPTAGNWLTSRLAQLLKVFAELD